MRLRALALVLSLAPLALRAQSSPTIVGTWRLVSFVNPPDSTGKTTPYWDDHPDGRIMYTADGQMAAQLYDTRRPKSGTDWLRSDADAMLRNARGLTTYFGRYTIDTVAHTVSHRVEGAMSPDWIGTTLVRSYRFVTPDRVELTTVNNAMPGRRTGVVLVWERVGR